MICHRYRQGGYWPSVCKTALVKINNAKCSLPVSPEISFAGLSVGGRTRGGRQPLTLRAKHFRRAVKSEVSEP